MLTYKVTHLCYVAADRRNVVVSQATVNAHSAVHAATSITSASSGHWPMTRDPYQDNAMQLCFVSNLGHIFMVQPLDK